MTGRDGAAPLRGVSMWPLTTPWRAWIDPTGVEALEPGDIGVYLAGDSRLVFHRVVGRTETHVLFRPDTLGHDDPPVPRAAVVGRVHVLGLGPVRIELPRRGKWADVQRKAGIAWSRVAPELRRVVAEPSRAVRHRVRDVLTGLC